METLRTPAEGRALLRNVSWETYERLISEREENPAPRFFYDRGVLEIMSPYIEHESLSRVTGTLVGEIAIEMDTDIFDAGSTTYKREDLEGGFEPDGAFYFGENIERVRGKKKLDLDAGDPVPDIVIEVDITSFSLNKPPDLREARRPRSLAARRRPDLDLHPPRRGIRRSLREFLPAVRHGRNTHDVRLRWTRDGTSGVGA